MTESHRHSGDELIFVLDGVLEVEVHGTRHRLGWGDAMHFDARFDHAYRGVGPEGCRAVIVVHEPAKADIKADINAEMAAE